MNVRGRLWCSATLVATILACQPAPRPPKPLLNVVFITIDTLRADALGAYGQSGDSATPNADRMAAESIVFTDAVCPMPQTRPSHFSMFTAQHPREHGVLNNVTPLPEKATTLAEALSDAGWQTAAYVSTRILGVDSGARQGFETFQSPGGPALTASETVPRVLSWLKGGRDPRRPFFLWVHLFDPHMPYAPPPEYRPSPPRAMTGTDEISWPVLLRLADRSGGLAAEVLDYALKLYAGEVAYTDRWLGVLLDGVAAQGLDPNTVALLTSDHGECFDHGIYFEHSDCLYEGGVRVPLILRMPDGQRAGTRVERQVQMIDLAATLVDVLGVPRPKPFRGRSLLTDTDVEPPALLQRPLYQRTAAINRPARNARIRSVAGERLRDIHPDRDIVALRGGGWKYIRDGSAEALFNLKTDPHERAEMSQREPRRLYDARRTLSKSLRDIPLRPADPGGINPELRDALRALGYVGS
jgi:choline-sulfatase